MRLVGKDSASKPAREPFSLDLEIKAIEEYVGIGAYAVRDALRKVVERINQMEGK